MLAFATRLTALPSVEHNDVDIVAVNDPFIEPHYAVSGPLLFDSLTIRGSGADADGSAGLHAPI